MIYYAMNNALGSTTDIIPDGSIEITYTEYSHALNMLMEGYSWSIYYGTMKFYKGSVYLVDSEGFYQGSSNMLPDDTPLIQERPDDSLRKPKWVEGQGWVEGEDPEVILEEKRKIVWNRIKNERDWRQSEGGIFAGGYWFHSNVKSRIQQLRLEKRAETILESGGSVEDPLIMQGQQVLWKTMDGGFVPLTVGLAIEIGNVAEVTEMLLFQTAEDHRQSAWASPDPEVYDYSGGWPPKYEEE